MMRFPTSLACAGLPLILLAARPATAQAQVIEPTGEAALAWRLDSLSSRLLGADRPPAAFKLSAALLQAAEKLDPDESRFPRLRSLALSQAGDTEGAIEALKRYRALDAADPVAQVQLIDLYASQQQTLDAKVKYLSDLADNQKLGPEVRAQLATEAATLLAQKSPELAAAMATKAVKLYPLPRDTQLYYYYVGRNAQLPEQVAALLAVLKADPAQVEYLRELANLLAENGLAEQSLQWYELVASVVNASYAPPPPGYHNFEVDYAAEWAIAGHLQSADTLAGAMINRQPLDADAWLLKLTVARAGSDQTFNQTLDLARTAFVRRWNRMHGEVLSGHASTEPIVRDPSGGEDRVADKIEPLDPAPVLARVQQPGREGEKSAVVSVASDLAWFELYFDHNADAAGKWIQVLRPLLPADAPTLLRLEGWKALVAGDRQQARQILGKIQDRDPLAALGLIVADREDKKPADPTRIQKLLDQNRVGLAAAMLWTYFKNDGVQPTSRPSAAAVEAELRAFPVALLSVLEPRQAGRVYTVRAEPLQTSYDFATPVLARVSIQNVGNVDVTVGPDSLLHSDLWFNARTLGADGRELTGVAVDRLQGAIVLPPHHEVSQVVRLDEGPLRELLENSPGAPLTMVDCSVVTNPIAGLNRVTHKEVAVSGPGGTAISFYRTFAYAGVPLTLPSGQHTLEDWLTSGSPVQKIHAADLLAAYLRLARESNADEATKKLATGLPVDLNKLRHDSVPMVSCWASYVSAGMATSPQEGQKIAAEMASSPQWSARLLSLLAGGARPASERKQVAQRLANDPDPIVKSAAEAMLEWAEEMPEQTPQTTQPATRPIQ